MKSSTKAFTALIVVTVGILIGLMEANIAIQRQPIPKPKQTDHYFISPSHPIDNYPYAPFNIIHSEIKLNQEDIK